MSRYRDVMWTPWQEPGLEHLHLEMRVDAIVADGLLTRLLGGQPFRWHYTITCRPDWRVSHMLIRDMLDDSRRLELRADGGGRWTDAHGSAVEGLTGCLDCDLSATPFTNTLPIRRLGLAPGASSDLQVAYVKLPEMTCRSVVQRYTCISASPRAVYRYDGIFRDFSAELCVDADGLVMDYPETFRRVWPVDAS